MNSSDKKMRKITEIIIHCSATPEGRNVTTDQIDRWHKERGFKKIGYHYVIYLDGSIHVGRKEEEIGAHTVGHNANSIGICYVGGCAKDGRTPKDTRTEAQKNALCGLLADLVKKYPDASIHGHREFANKACPCFDVQAEYKNI